MVKTMLRKLSTVLLLTVCLLSLTLSSPGILKAHGVALAAVTFDPTSGHPPIAALAMAGTRVAVTGTNFSPDDGGGCRITSPPGSGLVIDTSGETCAVNPSTLRLSAYFKVGAGSYWTGDPVTVTVMGLPALDSAAATFTVKPTIRLSQVSASPETTITYGGSGFSNTVAPGGECSVAPLPGPSVTGTPVAALGQSCFQDTQGNVVGNFVVASVDPGIYAVTVWDATVDGPTASTTLIVRGGPLVAFSQYAGPVGTIVTVTGSGFSLADVYVDVSTDTTVSPFTNLFTPIHILCAVSEGNMSAGCNFTVRSNAPIAPPPGYTLKIAGNTGDSFTANFLVTATNPDYTLTVTAQTDASVPLAGVTVRWNETEQTTDESGAATFTSSPGTASLSVQSPVIGDTITVFSTWSDTSTENPRDIGLNTDESLTATFTEVPPVALNASAAYHGAATVWTYSGTADSFNLYWSLNQTLAPKTLWESALGTDRSHNATLPPETWNRTTYLQVVPVLGEAELLSIAGVAETQPATHRLESAGTTVIASTTSEIKVRLDYRSLSFDPISSGVQIGEILTDGDTPTPRTTMIVGPVTMSHYGSTGYYIIDWTPGGGIAPGTYRVWFFLWNSLPSDGGPWEAYIAKVVVTVTIT